MRRIFYLFFALIALFIAATFMTLNSFNEIKSKYKEIEPNLDNYSAAEIIFLSFERMRTSLLYRNNDYGQNFAFKKNIFDSKIKILETKSESRDSFFYDSSFIKELNILKQQSLELSALYNDNKNATQNDILDYLDKMEVTLIDLQEIIYRIQIHNFNETKSIIQDNTDEAEILALACLSLLFIIITVLWIHFNKLRKTLKEKNTFISSIYHELSSSIQSIVIASDIISSATNGKDKETANIISYHANKLLIQTRDILDYSRIEMGNVSVHESSFMINTIVQEAVSSIDNKNNNTFIIRRSTISKKIISDKQKISRILINLLDNSNKNTSNGKITISTKSIKGKLYLSVRDNGCGFNIKKINHLFKAFNQGAEKDTKQGLGLGLTIIKNHVTVLKGNIRVKSQEGKGTLFLISIPIYHSDY